MSIPLNAPTDCIVVDTTSSWKITAAITRGIQVGIIIYLGF